MNYTAASEAVSAYYDLDTEADDFDRRRRSGRHEGCYSPTPTPPPLKWRTKRPWP